MENSRIEWTDHTFNPHIGCTKVSPGCAHCYAEARDQRFAGGAHWGKGAPRQRTSAANWRQPLAWNREAEWLPSRPRVFCASLADWLDDEVPIEWLADLLLLIFRTQNLDWQLLTKRPQNWRVRCTAALHYLAYHKPLEECTWLADWLGVKFRGAVNPCPPANVWIGVTAEDQPRADERIPLLLSIPARVRFLSCEPLLGPVDIWSVCDRWQEAGNELPNWTRDNPLLIHWVICGGESGPGARPMSPAWARGIRDQCAAAGVPFFFKQHGEWKPADRIVGAITELDFPAGGPTGPKNPEWHNWPNGWASARVGKRAAGRLLDGQLHSAFPALT